MLLTGYEKGNEWGFTVNKKATTKYKPLKNRHLKN